MTGYYVPCVGPPEPGSSSSDSIPEPIAKFKNQNNPSLGSVFALSDSMADVISAPQMPNLQEVVTKTTTISANP